jgi:hypothetical protein
MIVACAGFFDLIEFIYLATVAVVLLGSLRSSSGLMIDRSAGARRDWERWSKRCKSAEIDLELGRRYSERLKQVQTVVDRVVRDKNIIVVASMGVALEDEVGD